MKKYYWPEDRKKDLGDGEWMSEPDKVSWKDEGTGLHCLIVRNHMGALCGYVGVPPNHLWYEKKYHEIEASVHGGLTFSGFCQEGEDVEERGICHADPEKVWWLGFDCGHAYDLVPHGFFCEGDVYRNIHYVKSEVEDLARQIKSTL